MTIATMEELTQIPNGTTVTITEAGGVNHTWTVGEGGLVTTAGNTIPFDQFTGTLQQGVMRTGPLFNVGDLFINSTYHYLIIALDEEQEEPVQAMRLRLNRGEVTFSQYHWEVNFGEQVLDLPPWHAAMLALGQQHYQAQAQIAALTAAPTPSYAYDRLVEDLTTHVQEEGSGSSLRNLLADHDIVVTETVDVTVTVEGHSSVDLETRYSLAFIEELIQPHRQADWGSSTDSIINLNWTSDVTIPVQVQVGSCACGDVSDEMVDGYLVEHDFTYDSFEVSEYDCPNC